MVCFPADVITRRHDYDTSSQISNCIILFLSSVDGNKRTKETVPATEAAGILSYISNICTRGPQCVDTLVIYLNGPAMMNGNMLLWDRNGDGIADGTEILRIRQILERLKNCSATWVNIIADQNYAGHLVDKIREEKLRHSDSTDSIYHKISVYTSTTKRSYSWGNEFTRKWIQTDNIFLETNQTGVARKMRNVYKVRHHN